MGERKKVMNEQQETLSSEETLKTLNSIAIDYYEMGLTELSEQIRTMLNKKGFPHSIPGTEKHYYLFPRKAFAFFGHSHKK